MIQSILFGLLLFWKVTDDSWQALWLDRWVIVGVVLGLLFIFRTKWKSPIFPVTLGYVFVCGYLSTIWHHSDNLELVAYLRQNSQDFMLSFLSLLLFIHLNLSVNKALYYSSICVGLGIVLSYNANVQTVLLSNPTMASSFVVLGSMAAPWSIIPVALSRSYTAAIAFGAMTVALHWKKRWVRILSYCLVPVLAAIIIYKHPDNGRLEQWSTILSFWWNKGTQAVMLGTGLGTSRTWLPLLSEDHKLGSIYLWAHNDWLQWLVELGVVGFTLSLCAVYRLYSLCTRSQKAVLIGMSSTMLTNFPNHWAITALIGWSLISEVAVKRS